MLNQTDDPIKRKPVGKGGAGRGQGRKAKLIQGKATQIYLDLPTRKVLQKIDPKKSRAVRLMAGTEPDEHLDPRTRAALQQIRTILATLSNS